MKTEFTKTDTKKEEITLGAAVHVAGFYRMKLNPKQVYLSFGDGKGLIRLEDKEAESNYSSLTSPRIYVNTTDMTRCYRDHSITAVTISLEEEDV